MLSRAKRNDDPRVPPAASAVRVDDRLDPFRACAIPFLSRRSYALELLHIGPWSLLAGLIEGQFASVVVSKTFHGSDFLIALASATPVGAQLFSLIWGMLCIGRPKRMLFTIFASGVTLLAGLVATVPPDRSAAPWFIAQMAAAQILLAGVVTVRSAIWKLNYPRSHRGQIAARIQRVRAICSVVALMAAGNALDTNPSAYRILFPIAAACGVLGVLISTRIRVRRDRVAAHRRGETLADGITPGGWIEPYSLTALISPGHVLGQMVRVLRRDRRFAIYCVAQSLTGLANLLTVSVSVAIVTRDLDPGDSSGFWISTALVSALSNLAMTGTITRWGRLFDSLGVLRFRVVNVYCWGSGLVFGLAGTIVILNGDYVGPMYFPIAMGLFALRSLANGLGMAGGALAWNLGHLDFAQPEEAEIYMGIHVSLTGLRGLLAPLIGMWVWQFTDLGIWIIGLACAVGSLITFRALAIAESRAQQAA